MDEAALMCVRKSEAEKREILQIDSAASNMFPVQLEFSHDSRVFHQNAITKKLGANPSNAVTAPVPKPIHEAKPATAHIVKSIPRSKSKGPTLPIIGKKFPDGFVQQKV